MSTDRPCPAQVRDRERVALINMVTAGQRAGATGTAIDAAALADDFLRTWSPSTSDQETPVQAAAVTSTAHLGSHAPDDATHPRSRSPHKLCSVFTPSCSRSPQWHWRPTS